MYRHLLTADRSRRGSVAVEYACLITIIIAILIPSVASIGLLMHKEFSALDASSSVADTNETSPATPASPLRVPPPTSREPESVLIAEFSLVFAVLAIVAVIVLAYRRHRFQSRVEEAEEALDSEDSSFPAHMSAGLFDKRQKIQMAISTHWCKGVDGCLLVSELMTRGPKCVSSDLSSEDTRALMIENDLHHLLVTDTEGNLVGVVSTHDFDRREGDHVGAVMTPEPYRVLANDTISAAITVLLTNRVHCLPVENKDGQLVGVLTGSDIAMGLQCALRALEEVSMVLAGRGHRVVPLVSAHPD